MRNRFNINESEKNRIRKLHKKVLLAEQPNPDAGDYHMWTSCAGGGTYALFSNQTQTANGQSCHNAANQGIPGLVLACTQALVNAFGTGPVLQWGTGSQAVKACYEYQGTQFYNNIPPVTSPSQGGSYSVPQTLSNCSQCTGGDTDVAWMCTDVGGGVGGTGCQQMPCPYGSMTNSPGNWNTAGGCWVNQIDCNNGGLNPSINANPCGGYDAGTEYECTNGQCVPWQGGTYTGPTALSDCQAVCQPQTMWKCSQTGSCIQDPSGTFQTQSDCQATGCGDIYCVDCINGNMTLGTAGVCPSGYVSAPGTPGSTPPSPVCYECVSNNCIGPGWSMGQNSYNSQADCQVGCIQQNDWECTSPGNCNQTAAGTFPTQAACMASPGCQGPMDWECDMTNGCSQTAAGTHPSQSACETACCNDVITNWGWAQGSMNNPCNKFWNLFYNNLPTTFEDQCKYDYLYNMVLNLPGANPCVSGNFINLLDGMMGLNGQGSGNIGCYGNPASGGVQGSPALYNSVCGKVIQFGNATPMTASKFFKWQYAIDFANTNGCIC